MLGTRVRGFWKEEKQTREAIHLRGISNCFRDFGAFRGIPNSLRDSRARPNGFRDFRGRPNGFRDFRGRPNDFRDLRTRPEGLRTLG